jgi:hypothetical protein
MKLSLGNRLVLTPGGGEPTAAERPVIRIPRQLRQLIPNSIDWKKTETTRYLCAAAHLHGPFRDHVIDKLTKGRHQALAVSYGVDTATVLKHCLAARKRMRVRNLVIGLAIFVSYLIAFAGFKFASSGIFIFSGVLYLAVAFAAILAEVVIREHKTVRAHLSEANYNPDCVDYPGIADLTRDLRDTPESNVIIYSGFSPFVGSGINIGGWSLALDVSRGREDLGRISSVQPFEIKDLYSEITAAIVGLDLGNLAIEDKLCVNGRDIRDDPRFLPNLLDRPLTKISQDVVEGFVNNPSTEVRHYKQIRVVDWGGELVLSIFLRLAKTGRNLFIETNFCLLTPVNQGYQNVDAMDPQPGLGAWIETGFASAVRAVAIGLFWPFLLAAKAMIHHKKWEGEALSRKVIRKNPTFDRGAVSSVREDAGSREYQRYFQKLDKEMYVKILEPQIIDAIVRFLDRKGIETTDLKERRTTILNSGVIVSGTMSVQGDTVAIGGQARVEKREASRTAHA